MNKKSFIKGIICGFFIPVALIVLLAFFNIGNVGNFLQSAYLLQSKSLESLTFSQKVEGAISGMIDELDDPYSYYLDPEEFNSLMEEVNGLYVGIGVYIAEEENSDYTTIMSPIKVHPPLKLVYWQEIKSSLSMANPCRESHLMKCHKKLKTLPRILSKWKWIGMGKHWNSL